MSDCIKAERAEVPIGLVRVPVYKAEGIKEYLFSGRNISDAINEAPITVTRFFKVKSLKDLPGVDSERNINPGKYGSPFIPIPQSTTLDYWMGMAVNGNAIATAIMRACAEETIERRADREFGVQRTEDERDEKLQIRMKRVLTRLSWTDVIKRDQEDRGIYLSEMGAREFASLTAMVNRRLFGVSHFSYDRDNMDFDQQLDITAFERVLVRRYKEGMDLGGVIYDCLDFYQSVEH